MKKHFITGLALLLPLVLTLMIIFFLFNLFTRPFVPIVSTFIIRIEESLQLDLPSFLTLFISQIFALILLCLAIFLLGVIAQWFLVRHILYWGNRMFSKIPFIKTIYKTSKDIFTAFFSTDEKKAFKHPVIVPFPYSPSFSLGFQAGEVAEEIQQKIKEPLVSVFMPTAPHPISGFLFFVKEQEAHMIQMTNEESIKFLVSCGIIVPEAKECKIDEIL